MITDINVGLVPNDGLGDKLRMAFVIVNNNFDYINGILTGNNTLTISQITGLQAALDDIMDQLIYIPQLQDDINSINDSIYNINSQITSNNSSIADLYNEITDLRNELLAIIDQKDLNVVHLTGNETINGVKTFTNNTFRFGSAIISAAGLSMSRTYTLPNQAGSIALDANVVHMTGNETITGIKTFISDLIVNGIDVGRGNSNTSVLVGNDALKSNTGGNSNVAIGYQAIFSATNSSSLVAVGSGALKMNSSGSANTAIGTEALTANTTGNNNTAVGRDALTSNTQGFGNTSVGRSALFTNLGGINNSAFGGFALYSNISGAGNVAIGVSASSNTTGNNNIAIGLGALQNNINGSANIVIGATASALGTNNTNSIVIGAGAVGLGSNTVVLGNINTTLRTAIYGNLLLGITTDNGVDRLQVNGTINATAATTANQVVIKSQLDLKANLPIKVLNITVTNTGWTLVSGIYQKNVTNSNILTTSIVYIVPKNSTLNIVQNAEVFPEVLSNAGSVTIYAKFIPTASFNINLNIFN